MAGDDQLHDTQARHALAEAERLVEAGFHLTPVRITRRENGKKDARFFKAWRRPEAWSNDFDVVRDWWIEYGGCSFAYSCAHSGVEGVDLDAKSAQGIDAPFWWQTKGHPVGSLVVRTPTGGQHHVWRVREDGLSLPQEAGGTFPGVDTRNRSGLFFAPGAFVEGEEGTYQIVGELRAIAAMHTTPDRVIQLFPGRGEREERPRDGQVVVHDREWQRAQIAEAEQALRSHDRDASGYRNKILHLGLMYGRVVEQGFMTAEQAEERFLDAHRSVWGQQVWQENLDDFRNALADGPGLERWVTPETMEVGEHDERVAPSERSAADLEARAAAGGAEELDELVERAYARLKARRTAERRLNAEEAGDPAPPSSTTLRDLLAEPDEDAVYLVNRLWPIGGKVILSAQQKAGKTTMVGNLLRSLIDGDPVLGPRPGGLIPAGAHSGFEVSPLGAEESIFVADFELDRRMIRRWLREHRIRSSDRIHVETFRGLTWDVRDDKVRARWARYLRERNVRVIILDPLAPVLSSLDIDEIDNKGVGQFLHAMDALVAESGASELLITHHTTHDGERGRGASVLRGWPDAEWRFVVERPDHGGEPEPGATRFFAAMGRDVAEPERALAFEVETRTLMVLGGSRTAHAVDKHSAALVHIVEDRPGITKRDLLDAVTGQCSIRKETATKVISTAVTAGLIHVHDGPRGSHFHHIGAPGPECLRCVDEGRFEWKPPA